MKNPQRLFEKFSFVYGRVWTEKNRKYFERKRSVVLLPIHLVKDMYEYQLKNVQF